MLIALANIPEREESICLTVVSHSCWPYLYLIDEFFYLFLVELDGMSTLDGTKVLSFCFWC